MFYLSFAKKEGAYNEMGLTKEEHITQLIISVCSGALAAGVSVWWGVTEWQETTNRQQLTSYKTTITELILFKDGERERLERNPNGSSQNKLKTLRALTSDTITKLNHENLKQLVQFLESVNLLHKNSLGLLAESNLENTNFKDVALAKVNLTNSNLEDAILEKANLNGAILKGTTLIDVNLRKANLENADLSWIEISNRPLKRTKLNDADLVNASLKGTNLVGANLRGTNLKDTDIELVKSLEHAIFDRDTKFNKLDEEDKGVLSKAYEIKQNANLRGADLRGADLRGADLRGADLRGAKLSFADLKKADLTNARLRKANLSGVDLTGAEISPNLQDSSEIATLCSTTWIDGRTILNPQETCDGIPIPLPTIREFKTVLQRNDPPENSTKIVERQIN